MFRKKKGQAAMEFLMTYGWAILAAIIVIGAIGYLYLSNIGASGAAVSAPFYVNSWVVNTTGVYLEIKNSGADTYVMTNVNVDGCSTDFTTDITMRAGQVNTTSMTGCGAVAGDSFKGDITITYNKVGSSLSQESTGQVAAKIQ